MLNLPLSKFCSKCGQNFLDSKGFKNKNTLIIVVTVLGSLLFSCFICGLVGGIQENTSKKTAPNGNIKTQESPPIRTLTVQSTPEAAPTITPAITPNLKPNPSAAEKSVELNRTENSAKQIKTDAEQTTKRKSAKTTDDVLPSSGATAKCRDGSLSYSGSRRGTCSRHGGVALWY